ncbi:MAG: hypothetical protein WAT43_01770 [Chitinophagales bacterium]
MGTLFLVLNLVFKKSNLNNAAFLLLIIGAVTAIIANNTGEGAEEMVEEIAGVSHQSIHTHEDAASIGLKIILITGIFAACAGIAKLKFPKAAKFLLIATFVGAIASSGYMSYVGLTGGEIRHSEIRGEINIGSSKTTPANNAAEQGGGEAGEDAEEDD